MARDNRSARIQADGTAFLQPTRRARRPWAALVSGRFLFRMKRTFRPLIASTQPCACS